MITLKALVNKLKPFKLPPQGKFLAWLFRHFPLLPIESRKVYRAYCKAIRTMMYELEMGTLNRAERRDAQRYLASAIPFIVKYQDKTMPITASAPHEVLAFMMDQHDLGLEDVAKDLGGRPAAAEILRGRRNLTKPQIHRLARRFHIPSTVFQDDAAMVSSALLKSA